MKNLGKLEKIDLREAWNHEALDFTQWLAKEENLDILAEELGIETIKVIQTEANAGDFKIDILAEEEQTGDKIIIENQLEKTNHDHLGKILTYASTQDAKYIIWIAKEVRDEHKQAIDWLNEHTDENINFFAIQIELWQIGNSEPAPKFNIISKPNDWTKTIKKSSLNYEPTETKLSQLNFWKKYKEKLESEKSTLKPRNPRPQHWYNFAIGNSISHLYYTINTQNDELACGIWIRDEKELFNFLFKEKNRIEKELGEKLDWAELPGKKASRIKISCEADIDKPENWDKYFNWMKNVGEKFQKVFSKYIKEYQNQ